MAPTTTRFVRTHQPRNNSTDLPEQGARDRALGTSLLPGEHHRHRYHGGADNDTHKQVHPAEGESNLVEDDRQQAHESAEDEHSITRHLVRNNKGGGFDCGGDKRAR